MENKPQRIRIRLLPKTAGTYKVTRTDEPVFDIDRAALVKLHQNSRYRDLAQKLQQAGDVAIPVTTLKKWLKKPIDVSGFNQYPRRRHFKVHLFLVEDRRVNKGIPWESCHVKLYAVRWERPKTGLVARLAQEEKRAGEHS